MRDIFFNLLLFQSASGALKGTWPRQLRRTTVVTCNNFQIIDVGVHDCIKLHGNGMQYLTSCWLSTAHRIMSSLVIKPPVKTPPQKKRWQNKQTQGYNIATDVIHGRLFPAALQHSTSSSLSIVAPIRSIISLLVHYSLVVPICLPLNFVVVAILLF